MLVQIDLASRLVVGWALDQHSRARSWTLVPAAEVEHGVTRPDATVIVIAPPTDVAYLPTSATATPPPVPASPTRRAPLGAVAGARSGDKGGNANIGLWTRTEHE